VVDLSFWMMGVNVAVGANAVAWEASHNVATAAVIFILRYIGSSE